jgi:hypothetical protein
VNLAARGLNNNQSGEPAAANRTGSISTFFFDTYKVLLILEETVWPLESGQATRSTVSNPARARKHRIRGAGSADSDSREPIRSTFIRN